MLKKLLLATCIPLMSFAMGGPSLVHTAKIVKGEVNPLQEFVGTLNFDRSSSLAAQNSGVVKSINFEVGDSVKKGQIVCIIEAMKLFNEIESEVSGKIVKILVEDATPIEFDQELFWLESL